MNRSEARIEPEVLMVETDHDLRDLTDMLLHGQFAKNVFHQPGIAGLKSITRPLGVLVDHCSIPFQISLQNATSIENLDYLKTRMADLLKTIQERDEVIATTKDLHRVTDQLDSATRRLTAATHRGAARRR